MESSLDKIREYCKEKYNQYIDYDELGTHEHIKRSEQVKFADQILSLIEEEERKWISWKQLIQTIVENVEDLNDTCTVYDKSTGEFYPVDAIQFQEGDYVIDDGHMFLTIDS